MAIRIHFDDGEVFEEKCPVVDAKTKGDFLLLCEEGTDKPRQSVYDAFKAYCEKQCIVADMTLQSFGAEIAKICGVTREENEVAKRDCMGRLVGIYRYCKLKWNPGAIENA